MALPARIAAQIRDQDERAEILISVIQLVIVATFLTLYSLSPKTFDPAAETIEPVPIAGLFYVVFTLLRLFLAVKRIMPQALVFVSILVDMGLLMLMIWSFHLQYDQPPSFYLKAPTLLYVFIFIALRALRFQARFVIFSGIAAAIGWLGMLGYALWHTGAEADMDAMGRMITRDYVQYLTGNYILLGAEFDKIASILVVTAIIAAAIARARALLVRAVSEEVANRDLSRFFSPEVADRIRGSEHAIRAGEGEVKHIAVLTTDLRGFTGLAARLSPGEVMGFLGDFQARVVPAIRSAGGVVDKFTGDGLIATFGAFEAKPDQARTYAADAFQAADNLLAAVDGWNAERMARGLEPVRIGIAIDAGEVLVGAVGAEDRLEFTVIGDAVNRGAKLEKENKVQRSAALATCEAYEAAVAQGYAGAAVRRVEGARVEGLPAPVNLAIIADHTAVPASSSTGQTPSIA